MKKLKYPSACTDKRSVGFCTYITYVYRARFSFSVSLPLCDLSPSFWRNKCQGRVVCGARRRTNAQVFRSFVHAVWYYIHTNEKRPCPSPNGLHQQHKQCRSQQVTVMVVNKTLRCVRRILLFYFFMLVVTLYYCIIGLSE